MPDSSQFNTDRTCPGRWTITFGNPPINMFVPSMIVELGALMTGLEADRSVKVVVFQSANPEFFVAHLDVAKAAERPGVLDLWRDFVLRLSSFDREALGAAKAQINRFGMPAAAELQSSNDLFFPTLAWPTAQARRAKIRGIGYGVPSDFELNFGRYLPRLDRRSTTTRIRSPTDRRPFRPTIPYRNN